MRHTIRIGMAVAAGGAIGTLGRWGVAEGFERLGWSVWAFLVVVNVGGAFALGWYVADGRRRATHPLVAPFVTAGLLGSFTTFSGFTMQAVEGVRGDEGAASIAFVVGSMALGIAAALAGRIVGTRT